MDKPGHDLPASNPDSKAPTHPYLWIQHSPSQTWGLSWPRQAVHGFSLIAETLHTLNTLEETLSPISLSGYPGPHVWLTSGLSPPIWNFLSSLLVWSGWVPFFLQLPLSSSLSLEFSMGYLNLQPTGRYHDQSSYFQRRVNRLVGWTWGTLSETGQKEVRRRTLDCKSRGALSPGRGCIKKGLEGWLGGDRAWGLQKESNKELSLFTTRCFSGKTQSVGFLSSYVHGACWGLWV